MDRTGINMEWWKNPELAFIYGNQQQQQQTQQVPSETIGKSGFTGNGPDGISQPNRRVPGVGNNGSDKHESEFNFDADSTQAIGPDVLQGAMQAAKSGTLDINKMREAIGQSPKQGFQAGGLDPAKPLGQKPVGQNPVARKPMTSAPQTIGAPAPKQPLGLNSTIPKPMSPKPLSPTPVDPGEITNIQDPVNIDPITIGDQTGDQSNINDSTDYLRDIMEGNSEYIQMLKDKAAQDMGGAGAAATAALKQEGAQAGMSPEQIASMGVTRQRDVEEQTGDVVGGIAVEEARMGVQAARDVFSQDMAQEQFQYQQDMDQFQNQLAQGDYSGAAQSFNKIHGTDIDFTKAIDAENLANFNNAHNNMTQAIGNDVSFDDWMATAKADGTFEKMNMTEGDIRNMYENMRLNNNQIYQASKRYQDMVDQGIITQDQMDDIMAIQAHMLSNPDGYSVTDSFQVTDANGKEIGNFKTKEEADAFAAENPGSKTGILNRGWVERTGVGTGTGTGTGTGEVADTTTDEYKFLKGLTGDEEPTPELTKAFEENFEVADALMKGDFGELTSDDLNGLNDVYKLMPKTWQDKNKFGEMIKKIDKDQGELYEAIQGGNVVKDSKLGGDLINSAWGKWTEDGKNRWKMSAPMQAFLKANKGKYIQLGGKYFQIQNYNADYGDRNSMPSITLYDPKSKKQITLESGKGQTGATGTELQAAYPDFFTAFVNPMTGMVKSDELLKEWTDNTKTDVEKWG